MIASEALEAFHARIATLDAGLAKLKGAEVTRAETIAEMSAIAKDWIRTAQQLRSESPIPTSVIDPYDVAMSDALNSTRQRTRASSYRTKIKRFVTTFYDDIIIPVIRFEGSPSQVAARQLQGVFDSALTADEGSYIEEASRCVGAHCNRAAIVLLWAAGVARMHMAVQKVGFDAYNRASATAGGRKGPPYNRLQKGATISSLPELQRGRDFDLLVVGMDLWGYDLQGFEELDRLLALRNSAAHPGMFQPSALEVQQYAQKVHRFVFQAVTL